MRASFRLTARRRRPHRVRPALRARSAWCAAHARARPAPRSGDRAASGGRCETHQHEQPAMADLASNELEEKERRLVRRVQVVEHEHERSRLRGRSQGEDAASNRRKRAPSGSSAGGSGAPGTGTAAREALSDVRRPGAELGPKRLGLDLAQVAAQRLNPGPVRGSTTRLPAAPDQHGRPARRPSPSARRRASSCRSQAPRPAETAVRGRPRHPPARRRAQPARARAHERAARGLHGQLWCRLLGRRGLGRSGALRGDGCSSKMFSGRVRPRSWRRPRSSSFAAARQAIVDDLRRRL